MESQSHNCWNCKFQKLGGDTFLGYCLYFELKGEPKKPIPPEIVDKGCKFYIEKETKKNKEHPLLHTVLDMFDGEIIK